MPETNNAKTSYTYNGDGTIATRTDPKGQVTSYSYDAYQRVAYIQCGGGPNVTLTYDNGTNGYGHLTDVQMGRVDELPWILGLHGVLHLHHGGTGAVKRSMGDEESVRGRLRRYAAQRLLRLRHGG